MRVGFILIMTAGTWSLSGLFPEPSYICHADPISTSDTVERYGNRKLMLHCEARMLGRLPWLEIAGSQFRDTYRDCDMDQKAQDLTTEDIWGQG